MTCTWVSVGSGKASTVRSRKANQPQPATMAVRTSTAALFFRENWTICSNTSVLELELVEEEDRSLAHVARTGLQPAPELDLVSSLASGDHLDALQLALAPGDEDHRLLSVGH